jgi:predicted metal-binding protein
MADRAQLDSLFSQHGYAEYKWIRPRDIVVGQWVRMKCMFGCAEYGRNACCPPNVPSVPDSRRFFDEYRTGVIFRFTKRVDLPEDRHAWSRGVNMELLKLEKAVFVAGYEKVFLLFMDSCCFCADCPGTREGCINPQSARPSPESMAVDVFATVRRCGFPIEVLADYTEAMNRYAFLLVE